jgi:DNA invertase Pin-like site-specific DNA recombinase
MVRRYADARGLIICETYLDAGVSGGTLERPALQRLLADCRAGKIGTVITQDLERLSRNPLSLIAVLETDNTTSFALGCEKKSSAKRSAPVGPENRSLRE